MNGQHNFDELLEQLEKLYQQVNIKIEGNTHYRRAPAEHRPALIEMRDKLGQALKLRDDRMATRAESEAKALLERISSKASPPPAAQPLARPGRRAEHDSAPEVGEPDTGEASRFIRALIQLDGPGEHYTYQTFDDSERKRPHLARIFHGKGNAEELKRLNAQGAGIYVCVNATDGKGRKESNIKRVRAVFVDADRNGETVLQTVRHAGLVPHLIIESSPGKFHFYWLIAAGFPLEKFKAVQAALALYFSTDTSVSDLPRVLRLPGFFHMKNPAAPFMVRVAEMNERAPYTLDEIVATLDLDLTADEPSNAPAAEKGKPANDLDRAARLADAKPETIAELKPVLEHLAAKGYATDEKRWTDVCYALGSLAQAGLGEQARELWMWFSALDPAAYDAEEAERRWLTREPSSITYKSIFAWGEQEGCPNPKSAAAQDYSTLVDRTDVGNANLLAKLTDGNLRHVPERRMWIYWDGQRWIEDSHGGIAQREALRVARFYHDKALELAKRAADGALETAEAKKIKAASESMRKWEHACRGKRAIEAMLAVASRYERIAVPLAQLNRDPWLLGAPNGVVDLRTGTLRAAARDDLVTKRVAVPFNPDAKAPRWQRFVDEITGAPGAGEQYTKRKDLAHYVQKALGYAMTGRVSEHKIFIFEGSGSNGKNVLLDVTKHVAGDYWVTIAPEALMATRFEGDAERPTPTAASLAGARAAISSESRDGQRLDVALIKRHTGGGFLTARQMRENVFTFEMSHKLFLMTNHRPALDHLDDAIRGRLHIVPFDRQWNRPGHPERDPALPDGDKGLPDALRDEAEGVLAWLVAGAVTYAKEGLEPPGEVIRITREYFQEQDPLGQWLEGYVRCDPRQGEKAAVLFDEFARWCEGNDKSFVPNTQTGFSLALKARGIAFKRGDDGRLYGVRSVEQVDAEALV